MIGTLPGAYRNVQGIWLRLFDKAGPLIPNAAEAEYTRAETERQRAEAEYIRAEIEHQRAEAAEAELTFLRAQLAQLKGQ